ncbi:J domain-containing protein [Actinomadura sediminis]|uniref:J domain-containing protein n=1 Tax=Actinomadura sediminis TaxID=1038904 RepID=A0ABW3EKP4_9ACTN
MSTLFGELAGNDAYELLGVRPDASDEDIQRAWRRSASAHHPDRVTDPEAKAAAEDRLRLINAARDVLTARRAAYDAARRGPVAGGADAEPVHEDAEEGIDDPWDAATPGTAASGVPNDPWEGASAGRRPPPPPPPPQHVPPPRYAPPPPRPQVRHSAGARLAIGCAVVFAALWVVMMAAAVYDAFLSPADDAESPPPIPSDFAGTWTGKITEKDEQEGTWKAKFVLPEGERGGKVAYLDGECSGSVVPVSYEDGILTLDTRFPGLQSGCDVGDVQLRLRDDGKLEAVYPPAGERKAEAVGGLRRE